MRYEYIIVSHQISHNRINYEIYINVSSHGLSHRCFTADEMALVSLPKSACFFITLQVSLGGLNLNEYNILSILTITLIYLMIEQFLRYLHSWWHPYQQMKFLQVSHCWRCQTEPFIIMICYDWIKHALTAVLPHMCHSHELLLSQHQAVQQLFWPLDFVFEYLMITQNMRYFYLDQYCFGRVKIRWDSYLF